MVRSPTWDDRSQMGSVALLLAGLTSWPNFLIGKRAWVVWAVSLSRDSRDGQIKYILLLAHGQYVRNLENEAKEDFMYLKGCVTENPYIILPYTQSFYGYGVIHPAPYYVSFILRL